VDDQVSTPGPRDVVRVAQVTVAAAVETVADCVSAGLVLGDDALAEHVGSDHRAIASHLRQVTGGHGPTIDAVRGAESVYCGDLGADPRWPAWSAAAQRDGFAAVVVLPLATGRVTLGHLTLYAEVAQAFPIHDTSRTLSFVEHAAVVLNAATGVDRRDRTMDRLTTVGQAQGMIMERFGVSPARAFSMLERASHRRGVMPHRLAEDIVARGVDDVLAHDADLV
jgi:hypothetical protein